jgi:hypothetical protein
LVNDFTSTPDQLLHLVLAERPSNGTNYTVALEAAGAIMCQNWSTERPVVQLGFQCPFLFLTFPKFRPPIMFFLSDGECGVSDETIQNVCRSAVQRG